MRGLTFLIPNKYGQYLADLLSGKDMASFNWRNGDGEAYYIEENELGTPLFSNVPTLTGDELLRVLTARDSYVIFADLKAFPVGAEVHQVETYEDFLASSCQFVLLVVDCSYVTVYAKSSELLETMFEYAVANGFCDIERIYDETDLRTSLVAF